MLSRLRAHGASEHICSFSDLTDLLLYPVPLSSSSDVEHIPCTLHCCRKIFQPNVCQLRTTDPADFAQCTAGRRIIMLGDSLMRLHFYSLACLLRANVTAGRSSPWNTSELRWQGNYTAKFGTNVMPVRMLSSLSPHPRNFCCWWLIYLADNVLWWIKSAHPWREPAYFLFVATLEVFVILVVLVLWALAGKQQTRNTSQKRSVTLSEASGADQDRVQLRIFRG